jgi:hypothetical protein
MAATHNDAMLIVELSKLAAMLGVPEAARTERLRPAGGRDDRSRRADDPQLHRDDATLVKHDLLDRDLVDDWIWIASFWERVGPAAKRARPNRR